MQAWAWVGMFLHPTILLQGQRICVVNQRAHALHLAGCLLEVRDEHRHVPS